MFVQSLPLISIAGTEWIWLAAIVLIFLFGAKKFPEIARSLGKTAGEFQKGRREIEKEIQSMDKELKSSLQESERPSAPIVDDEHEKLVKVAKSFDIDTANKSSVELRESIRQALARGN